MLTGQRLTLALPWLAGAVLGFAVCWFVFRGKPADPEVIREVDTVLAESPGSQAVRDSLLGLIAQLSRPRPPRRDTLAALLPELRSAADSVPVLVALVEERTAQRDSAESSRDSLALVSRKYADSAEARIARLDSTLVTARDELERVRYQPARPWAAGPVLNERGKPVGGMVSRDLLGRLALSAQLVREAGESRGYLAVQLRF